jgi:hypothetical protein
VGWFSEAFEGLLGVGSVDSMNPEAVLSRLPVRSEYSATEVAELEQLANEDPAELARIFEADGHPKWAAAIRSSFQAGEAREQRHQANIDQTARDIRRDASKVTRRGASWLPVVGILAAVVLLTQSGRR